MQSSECLCFVNWHESNFLSTKQLILYLRGTSCSTKHEARGLCSGQGGALSGLPGRHTPSFSDPVSKAHARIYKHGTKKKTKRKHAPGSTSAILCGSGCQRSWQQGPAKKKKETSEGRKRKHNNEPPPAAPSSPTQDGQGSRGTACCPISCPWANPGGQLRHLFNRKLDNPTCQLLPKSHKRKVKSKERLRRYEMVMELGNVCLCVCLCVWVGVECRGDHGVQREPSASPEPAQCHKCHACHAKWWSMSASATPATRSEGWCHQVPRLPRKVPRRPRRPTGTKRVTRAKCHKCHACHANWRSTSPSAMPATWRTWLSSSATPATQSAAATTASNRGTKRVTRASPVP